MITYIQGVLKESGLLTAIIETHGIGYEIQVPLTTSEQLPPTGNAVCLQTLVVYREDSQTIYGFYSRKDRDFFRTLIEKVSGIGPRTALNMLSRFSTDTLCHAIVENNIALLSQCPGIGKKTAERLILELSDKLGAFSSVNTAVSQEKSSPSSGGTPRQHQDALAAFIALGYRPADADKAIRKVLQKQKGTLTTEEIIKLALKG